MKLKTHAKYIAALIISTGTAAYTTQTLYMQHEVKQEALTRCAKSQNVYACKLVAIAVEEPRVVEVQAEILPPPAY